VNIRNFALLSKTCLLYRQYLQQNLDNGKKTLSGIMVPKP